METSYPRRWARCRLAHGTLSYRTQDAQLESSTAHWTLASRAFCTETSRRFPSPTPAGTSSGVLGAVRQMALWHNFDVPRDLGFGGISQHNLIGVATFTFHLLMLFAGDTVVKDQNVGYVA